MGKIRTRIIGDMGEEQKQKEEQKKRSQEKKAKVKKEESQASSAARSTLKETKKSDRKKKPTISAPRSRGKKYQAARKLIEKEKNYSLAQAITLLKQMKLASFDESVELHMNLDKEGLKGEVELPHATGKTLRVAIVNDQVLEDLEKGLIAFDVLLTHPSYMPRLAKFAKILGPRGLMPNPKAGTISPNPEELAKKFEKGTLRWKSESKFPLIHQMVGKVSYDETMLQDNIRVFIQSVGKNHIKEVFIKTTMSPALPLNVEGI